jgi:hypothetical protein
MLRGPIYVQAPETDVAENRLTGVALSVIVRFVPVVALVFAIHFRFLHVDRR